MMITSIFSFPVLFSKDFLPRVVKSRDCVLKEFKTTFSQSMTFNMEEYCEI